MNKLNNKWTHGNVKLIIPPPPPGFMEKAGIYSLHITIDKNVGEEVMLAIYDPTDFIYELRALKPFKFYTSSLSVNTNFGPVGCFLFDVTDPKDKHEPFAIFDKPINIANHAHLKPWLELANQTHLHLLLINKKYEVVGFFEFENNFNFDKAVDSLLSLIAPERIIDFDKAVEEYFRDYSLESLYELTKNK